MTENLATADWVPSSCTLPTVEQPSRRAEFDDFFAEDCVGFEQVSPLQIRLRLRTDPAVAARAASLAMKEMGCCSFFSFELTMTGGAASLTIATEARHADVLTALGGRARYLLEGSTP